MQSPNHQSHPSSRQRNRGLTMSRQLKQIFDDLPPKRRKRIEARYQELRQEVEGFRELLHVADKALADIGSSRSVNPPGSKVE